MVIDKVFENAVPVCFSVNNAFLPYTGVMIQSIIDHSNNKDNYDYYYWSLSESAE